MNRFEQRKLIRNLICLRKAIQNDVEVITDKLYQYGVFDIDTKLEILNAPNSVTCTKQVQCGILINKLIRSGQEAYTSFKLILEDLGYHKVMQIMEQSTSDKESTDNRSMWHEDKERTFILPNPTAYTNRNTRHNSDNTDSSAKFETCTVDTADDIHTLNRMVTFVLNKTDLDSDSDEMNISDKLKNIIIEEMDSCDKLSKTFNYNEYHYKTQQMTH